MEKTLNIPSWFYSLKEIPTFKHAVIAGGYLRDQMYKVQPNDVDIFFPITSELKFLNDFNQVYPELEKMGWQYLGQATVNPRIFKTDEGYSSKRNLKAQFNFKVGDQDVDLMAMRLNVEGFIANLIEDFPFANQQIVSDGKKIITSEGFDYDFERGTMTLRKIDSIKELPRLMEKYKKVSDKLKGLGFQSDYILTKRKGDDWL